MTSVQPVPGCRLIGVGVVIVRVSIVWWTVVVLGVRFVIWTARYLIDLAINVP